MKAKWAMSRRSRKFMRSTKRRTRRRMEEVSHELRHLNENVSIDAEPVKSMHCNRRVHTIEMIILPVRFQL